jgi:PPK2 family polyphosphate:nucleotide phosphotransferase
VPFDGGFRVAKADTAPPKKHRNDEKNKTELERSVATLSKLQNRLMANDRRALLLVFQAMDAAGKDGTIRAVMTGINPAGCEVFSFKKPSSLELDHDFLWRTNCSLPERGRIGIFNRSYYEEVLVVRAHPQLLETQRLPDRPSKKELWAERYDSIRDLEKHLARNGTTILKFWLNVSKKEQRTRFLARIDDPEANWKFSAGDIRERQHWDAYMDAYEDALNETSRPWAPWYAIPADDKSFMRRTIAEIIVETLKAMDLHYPVPDEPARIEMRAAKAELLDEKG